LPTNANDNVLQLVQVQLQPVDFFRQFFAGLNNHVKTTYTSIQRQAHNWC